jgi:E3 ubiquitin-protein ligase MARCH5
MMCRVCLDQDDYEELIAPCQCNGTNKFIHRACLTRWIEVSGNAETCPTCTSAYNEDVRISLPVAPGDEEQHTLWTNFKTLLIYLVIVLIVSLIEVFLSKDQMVAEEFSGYFGIDGLLIATILGVGAYLAVVWFVGFVFFRLGKACGLMLIS